MSVKTELRFTDERMRAIVSVAIDNGDWQQAIVDTYKGFGVYINDDDCPSIDPKLYALPADQWCEIGDALTHGASDLEASNRLMTWMNIGPSSFEDDDDGLPVYGCECCGSGIHDVSRCPHKRVTG